MSDDEQRPVERDAGEAQRKRAQRLHEQIEELTKGGQPPASPHEVTERRAREAADEDRRSS